MSKIPTTENAREYRGIVIAVKGNEVKRLNASTYRVRSQSNPDKWYLVQKDELRAYPKINNLD